MIWPPASSSRHFPVRVRSPAEGSTSLCLPAASRRKEKDMNQAIISGDVDSAILADQSPEEPTGDSMPWTRPLHGRGRIDLAGDVMSGRKTLVPDMDLNTALDIAGNWR